MWLAYFGLWVAGPHNFPCCVWWVPSPFKRHWVPHFLPNLTHFSRLTPIFTSIFPVFVLCTPILAAFMLRASLLTPIFALFFIRAACGTPVMLLLLRDNGFRTQLPPKIGSLAKTFLLALSLNQKAC